MEELAKFANVEIRYGVRVDHIKKNKNFFNICLANGENIETDFLLNATYASTNQILVKISGTEYLYEAIKIKYELCEIMLCNVYEKLQGTGITVMDGPFFLSCLLEKQGYIRLHQ